MTVAIWSASVVPKITRSTQPIDASE